VRRSLAVKLFLYRVAMKEEFRVQALACFTASNDKLKLEL
jgi:hypothetical protein